MQENLNLNQYNSQQVVTGNGQSTSGFATNQQNDNNKQIITSQHFQLTKQSIQQQQS